MTETEKKRLRNVLAKFEQARHCNVEVLSKKELEDGKSEVIAKIRGFKHGYLFQGDVVRLSWSVI